MKKTILGLAFLAIASVSFSAAAQNANNNTECANKTECVAKKCAKGDKAGKQKGDRKAFDAKKQAAREAALFEGINLTTEQKGRIEALNGAVKTSRQELKQAAKTARQNHDTTFNMRAQNKALRSKYIKDLGEILNSDQMITYLENYYVMTGGQKGHGKSMAARVGDRKGGKMMKADRRGNLKDMKVRSERKADSARANATL